MAATVGPRRGATTLSRDEGQHGTAPALVVDDEFLKDGAGMVADQGAARPGSRRHFTNEKVFMASAS
jgi:hypothetical protein